MFKPGSPVIYCKTKFSPDPGPRAKNISPSRSGDSYGYCVEKQWLVVEKTTAGTVIVKTRRGKRIEIDENDPNLRAATWFDRLRYIGRFPRLSD
ncbi:MAG: hypothetical protein AAF456_02600 [Planctomycetota bacterium]